MRKNILKTPDVPGEGRVIKDQQFGMLYGKWITGCKRGYEKNSWKAVVG